ITLLYLGLAAQAVPLLESCTRSAPVPGDSLLYLGQAYRALGHFDRAREAFARHMDCIGLDRERLLLLYVTLSPIAPHELARTCARRYRAALGPGGDRSSPSVPVLGNWWTRMIGHIALLDGWLKARQLAGAQPYPVPVIRTSSRYIGNRAYLNCWSRWFVIE